MPKSDAFLDLFKLTELLANEIGSLAKKINESAHIDTSTINHIIRSLQSVREIAYLTDLPKTANVAQILEHIFNQLSMGIIPYSSSLIKQCQEAITTITMAIKNQEKGTRGTTLTKVKHTLEDSLKKIIQHQAKQPSFDINLLGLGDISQELSPVELAQIQTTLTNRQPLFTYITNVRTDSLNKDILTIIKAINTIGYLITSLPTRATQPLFDYAFIFVFTSDKPLEKIRAELMYSGLLTQILPPNPPQIITIQGSSSTPNTLQIAPQVTPKPQQLAPTPQEKNKQRLLFFTIANNYFALPFANIAEVLPFDNKNYQKRTDRMVYLHHGKELKAFVLKNLLPAAETDKSLYSDQTHNVVVLVINQHMLAIIVEHILGHKEIDVGKKEEKTKDETLYTGQADFGNGKLAMIINVEKLYELVSNE